MDCFAEPVIGRAFARPLAMTASNRATLSVVIARLDRAIQYPTGVSDRTERPWRTGYPACAGYDACWWGRVQPGSRRRIIPKNRAPRISRPHTPFAPAAR